MILIADSHLSVRIEFSVCCNDYKVSNYDDDFGDGYGDVMMIILITIKL